MSDAGAGRTLTMDIDGGPLAGAWFGPARRDATQPVTVLLHEGLGSISMWGDFPDALAAVTQTPVFAYERQGHGTSVEGRAGRPQLPRVRDWMHDEALRVLPAVLADQHIAKPLLFSHSDGATIALIHAGHHPVRGVVSEAAHVFHDDMMASGARRATGQWAHGVLKRHLAAHHGGHAEMLLTGWLDWWRQSRARHWQIDDDLARIACPVLAIQGTGDQYGTPEQVKRIVSTVRGPAQSLFIEDCGHIAHHERRDLVLETVAAWIAANGVLENH